MRIYSSTSLSDFLETVRDQACKAKAPPAMIDKLDELLDMPDHEAEIEKLGEELTAMEDNRNDLAETLRSLEKNLYDDELDAPMIKAMLTDINNALSRSG